MRNYMELSLDDFESVLKNEFTSNQYKTIYVNNQEEGKLHYFAFLSYATIYTTVDIKKSKETSSRLTRPDMRAILVTCLKMSDTLINHHPVE